MLFELLFNLNFITTANTTGVGVNNGGVKNNRNIGDFTGVSEIEYVNHYTSTHDFDQNIVTAENLLARYRTEPTLVITTFLHSALVCLALSIPVVVFYPKPYNLAQKQSDRERFSCLDGLIRIYNFEEINDVNFQPSIINVDTLRQRIRCQFSLELNKILRQFA